MNIALPVETETWLRQHVADGKHASVAELIETLVAEHRLAELAIEQDDHLWAKPAVDQALASLARGEGSALSDVAGRLKVRLAARRAP